MGGGGVGLGLSPGLLPPGVDVGGTGVPLVLVLVVEVLLFPFPVPVPVPLVPVS